MGELPHPGNALCCAGYLQPDMLSPRCASTQQTGPHSTWFSGLKNESRLLFRVCGVWVFTLNHHLLHAAIAERN